MELIGPNFEKHHHMTYVRLKSCALGRPQKKSFVSWQWNDGDYDRARFELLTMDGKDRDLCAELSSFATVDEATDYFLAELFRVQSLVVPPKKVWVRGSACPWMDKRLLRLIQRKHRALVDQNCNRPQQFTRD